MQEALIVITIRDNDDTVDVRCESNPPLDIQDGGSCTPAQAFALTAMEAIAKAARKDDE